MRRAQRTARLRLAVALDERLVAGFAGETLAEWRAWMRDRSGDPLAAPWRDRLALLRRVDECARAGAPVLQDERGLELHALQHAVGALGYCLTERGYLRAASARASAILRAGRYARLESLGVPRSLLAVVDRAQHGLSWSREPGVVAAALELRALPLPMLDGYPGSSNGARRWLRRVGVENWAPGLSMPRLDTAVELARRIRRAAEVRA